MDRSGRRPSEAKVVSCTGQRVMRPSSARTHKPDRTGQGTSWKTRVALRFLSNFSQRARFSAPTSPKGPGSWSRHRRLRRYRARAGRRSQPPEPRGAGGCGNAADPPSFELLPRPRSTTSSYSWFAKARTRELAEKAHAGQRGTATSGPPYRPYRSLGSGDTAYLPAPHAQS